MSSGNGSWIGVVALTGGVIVLGLGAKQFLDHRAYDRAPSCAPSEVRSDCRSWTSGRLLSNVEHQEGRVHSREQLVDVGGRWMSANLPLPGSVRSGRVVSVEVWRDEVRAMRIGTATYRDRTGTGVSLVLLVLFGLAMLVIGLGVLGGAGRRNRAAGAGPPSVEQPGDGGAVGGGG